MPRPSINQLTLDVDQLLPPLLTQTETLETRKMVLLRNK